MKRRKITQKSSVFILFFVSALAVAAPHDSQVKRIDQDVIRIDKNLPNFTWTTEEDCAGEPCIGTISYWDSHGKIQKTVISTAGENALGSITGRYYSDCRLILSRVAPADPAAVKDSKSIDKFYFHKGKLLRVVLGGSTQTFGKDQTAYYQRIYGGAPKQCIKEKAQKKE